MQLIGHYLAVLLVYFCSFCRLYVFISAGIIFGLFIFEKDDRLFFVDACFFCSPLYAPTYACSTLELYHIERCTDSNCLYSNRLISTSNPQKNGLVNDSFNNSIHSLSTVQTFISSSSLIEDIDESTMCSFRDGSCLSFSNNHTRRKSISGVSVIKIKLDHKAYPMGNPGIRPPNRRSDEEIDDLTITKLDNRKHVKVSKVKMDTQSTGYDPNINVDKNNRIGSVEESNFQCESENILQEMNYFKKPVSAMHKPLLQWSNSDMNHLDIINESEVTSCQSADVKRSQVTVIRVPSSHCLTLSDNKHPSQLYTVDSISNADQPKSNISAKSSSSIVKSTSSVRVERVRTAKKDSHLKTNLIPFVPTIEMRKQSSKHRKDAKNRVGSN